MYGSYFVFPKLVLSRFQFHAAFTCPLIYNWRDLEVLISSIDAERSSEKIRLWWQDYKQFVTQLVRSTIKDAFF